MTEDRAKALFQDALDLPADQRVAFLDGACRSERGLRERVEQLLDAYACADDFLEEPVTASGLALLDPNGEGRDVELERPGDQVGPFRLVSRLGEGGFGTVWRARQEQPVRREVAVKVVKLGMDTVEVVRRFELERDVLARLDHPSIAKVFDAGATADGRPWFSMELVAGEPISRFADRHALSVRARLELFVEVARAIQYAHHQGVIHRDIKPSNVLVAVRDGRPQPRVIDFGIAKALDRAGAQHTLFSRERQLLGTPEYMSPEQVETWGAGVDARTDVYSLGVLLYELLAGSRPFDLRRIGAGRFGELLRRIREDDPERPTMLLLSLQEDESRQVARDRGLHSVRELHRQLRGDLDWIVVRALEKDRQRRYATPAELAADLERHLRDEPVTAGPPDLSYRLGKLARRYRGAFALVGLALLSLLVGSAFAVHGLVRAKRSERQERAARELADERRIDAERAFAAVESLLGAADPRALHGPDYTVRALLDDFAARLEAEPAFSEPRVEAQLRGVLGRTYRTLGQTDAARRHLSEALRLREADPSADPGDTMTSRQDLAWLWHDLGRDRDALELMEPVVAYRRAHHAADPTAHAASLDAVATFRSRLGELAAARDAAQQAWQICVERLGPEHADTLRCRIRLLEIDLLTGLALDVRDDLARLHARLVGKLPGDHPDLLALEHQLGVAAEMAGDLEAAERHYRSALDGRGRVFASDSPPLAGSRVALGWVLKQRGELEPAIELLEQGLEGFLASYGSDHVHVARARLRLGDALSLAGRHQDALEQIALALALLDGLEDAPLDEILAAHGNQALARWRAGDQEGAVGELEQRVDEFEAQLEGPVQTWFVSLVNLGRMQQDLARKADAAASYRRAIDAGRQMWPGGHPQLELVERWLRELVE